MGSAGKRLSPQSERRIGRKRIMEDDAEARRTCSCRLRPAVSGESLRELERGGLRQ